MVKKKAIIVRSNLLDRDIRVPKEIAALNRAGYEVTLLCWDRELQASPSFGEEADFREIRIRVKAPWGGKVLLFLPVWWCFSFVRLMLTKWDIAHALNFDSIIPTAIAAKLKRKPVIYEILETYEDRVVLPGIVRRFIIFVDRLFMRMSSAVILADEMQSEELGKIPNSRVAAVYDSPVDSFKRTKANSHKNKIFMIFQASVLNKQRKLNLDKLVSAVKDIKSVKLTIAGYGDQVEEVRQWSQQTPDQIEFLGQIKHSETLKRSAGADLLFELRSAEVPQHKYICGSKILQAMMCGTPILVNEGTSTAKKVAEENCGLVVDANNVAEIRNAIVKLRDNPKLCRELGANARNAYERKYSWEIMGRRLLALYEELTESEKDNDAGKA